MMMMMDNDVDSDPTDPVDTASENEFAQEPTEPKSSSQTRIKNAKKREKAVERSGLVYLARIPPHMTPSRVRELLSAHGDIGKIYLAEAEQSKDGKKSKKSKKHGKFTEGWVEFSDKKVARSAATMLNAQPIDNRKFKYDLWNIKYLPRFKWHHLTDQMVHERQMRNARLQAEIAQATRETKVFINNLEKSKTIDKIKSKREQRGQQVINTPRAKNIRQEKPFNQQSQPVTKRVEDLLDKIL